MSVGTVIKSATVSSGWEFESNVLTPSVICPAGRIRGIVVPGYDPLPPTPPSAACDPNPAWKRSPCFGETGRRTERQGQNPDRFSDRRPVVSDQSPGRRRFCRGRISDPVRPSARHGRDAASQAGLRERNPAAVSLRRARRRRSPDAAVHRGLDCGTKLPARFEPVLPAQSITTAPPAFPCGRELSLYSIPMETQEFLTHSPEETIALGRKLAGSLTPPKIVLLRGELGAGKTTLVKGIAEGFHAASEEDVTSPTFTLVHEYRGPEANLFHIDLYRIETASALDTLALDDFMGGNNLLLIEWGEKFPRFERERDVEIALERVGENERKVRVSG